MKIAILVGKFPPLWIAGTEVATFNLASHLVKRGHEVHIITMQDRGVPTFYIERGFIVHRVEWPNLRFMGPLIFWSKVFFKIRRIKPDIMHCQSLSNGIPMLFVKKIQRIPCIVWGQGSDVYLPGRLTRLASKYIIQNADAVLALTEDMKKKMQNISKRDVSVIPNGIDYERFYDVVRSEKVRKVKTILFVGRLHQVKGVRYLIEAMAIVHSKYPDIKLIIIGDGVERQNLGALSEKLALGDCIRFIGRVEQESIPLIMKQADIFVLPSISEGFGIVILEAMASGLPIIATRVGGIPDVVEDGVNGYLVDARNTDEIAKNIIKLIQNDVVRIEMAIQNMEKAKMYSWDEVSGTVESVYRDIIYNK